MCKKQLHRRKTRLSLISNIRINGNASTWGTARQNLRVLTLLFPTSALSRTIKKLFKIAILMSIVSKQRYFLQHEILWSCHKLLGI